MNQFETDNKILKEILKMLSVSEVNGIMQGFSDNEDFQKRVSELLDSPLSDKPTQSESLKEQWKKLQENESADKNSKSKEKIETKFQRLIKKYLASYLRGERDTSFKPSRSYLEDLVSNHAKWGRMMQQSGKGKQYHDDLRRVCFVFHLSLPEANELLWSASHTFVFDDFRDYVIVDCLKKKIYNMEVVDELLEAEGLLPLFSC